MKTRSVLLKLLVAIASVVALYWFGPLASVAGSWVPLSIAFPFLLSLLLHSELENIFQPYLMRVVQMLSHTGVVEA